MKGQLLEYVLRFERAWDERLCGPSTRVFRELLGYCIGRLVGLGADPAAVLAYCAEMTREFADQAGIPVLDEGSS